MPINKSLLHNLSRSPYAPATVDSAKRPAERRRRIPRCAVNQSARRVSSVTTRVSCNNSRTRREGGDKGPAGYRRRRAETLPTSLLHDINRRCLVECFTVRAHARMSLETTGPDPAESLQVLLHDIHTPAVPRSVRYCVYSPRSSLFVAGCRCYCRPPGLVTE
ncbi:hypothetical protein EVAR_92557_1 [Eumeta japonica]|uniref:Uncharacterized protein n=1 Tax=Eumeta variegata TaxID=151549 RepID=A0A4C1SZX2_EUMVA|nr:hypothetical protein EVAR_92557_1 [Eumeta japonica]